MPTVIQIEKMSLKQKLQIMETLWESISHHEGEFTSPAWHEQALRETETKLAAGQEKIVDWEEAKRDLR